VEYRMLAFVMTFVAAAAAAQPPAPSDAARPVDVGGFVDLEWRVMGLADHVSHGPAFAAGITFFDGALRVGVGAGARPGPMNPATFEVAVPDGGSYRGQSSLALRSDGAWVGLHVAAAFEVPLIPWLAIAVPVTVGYGGFGFYLTGGDRETPDGARVSEWENRLFGGRDSFLGVVIDAGVRFALVIPELPWMRPYLGVHYTIVPDFDTFVRRGYEGFSASLGVELGHGL
jgi:hypothetical protein